MELSLLYTLKKSFFDPYFSMASSPHVSQKYQNVIPLLEKSEKGRVNGISYLYFFKIVLFIQYFFRFFNYFLGI